MSKKSSKFDYDDDEWADDFRKDGKRYNAKREEVKAQRHKKSNDRNKFFDSKESE